MQLVLRQVDDSRARAGAQGRAGDGPRQDHHATCPSRAAENLIEEVELLGAVRLTQVEEAQQAIIRTIRELEEQGQIMVRRGGDDEFVE